MTAMSKLGPSTEATPGMTSFHRAKRQVHGLMRRLDVESRVAMQTLDADV
jgi:D-ribulokinase